MKCHEKGCSEKIDEKTARLVRVNWFYCLKHAKKYGGIGE